MPYKTLIFGVDDLFPQLQPLYMQAVERGTLDIVAYAVLDNDKINIVTPDDSVGGGGAIIWL